MFDGSNTVSATVSSLSIAPASAGTSTGPIANQEEADTDGIQYFIDTNYQPSNSELVLFRTVQHVTIHDIANMQVNPLLDLQRLNGVKCNFRDLSSTSVNNVQDSLAYVIDSSLICAVRKSVFYGLILDESTDISVHKMLAVCIRYVQNGKMATTFLSNIRIQSGTADSIVKAVVALCRSLGLNMKYLVGVGSDGASVMTGRETGVVVRLRNEFSPYLVGIHCLAHRLALASSDAADDVPYVNDFKSHINKLYAYFSTSAVRHSKLEAMHEVMDEPALNLKSSTDIRWLSLNNAIQAIYRTYGSVVNTLAEEGKSTKNALATGLHKYCTTYIFCAFLCLLVDVLNVLTKLCKTLQGRDFLYSYVKPKIALAIGELRGMKEFSGPALKSFQSTCVFLPTEEEPKQAKWQLNPEIGIDLVCTNAMLQKFSSTKLQYLQSLVDNLETRLSAHSESPDGKVLETLSHLTSPPYIITLNADDKKFFVGIVSDWYKGLTVKVEVPSLAAATGTETHEAGNDDNDVKTSKHIPVLTEDGLLTDLNKVQGLVTEYYSTMEACNFLTRILEDHSSDVPNYAAACKLMLCIPVTSVECERAFSLQNRIKTKLRNRLNEQRINVLMKIATGPPTTSFDFATAVRHWRAVTKRRLHFLYRPHKRRGYAQLGQLKKSALRQPRPQQIKRRAIGPPIQPALCKKPKH
jgi:hypothetical protein